MNDTPQGLFGDELPEQQSVELERVVFDYRLLSANNRELVLQKTDETQMLLKRAAERIIQIGNNLQEVKRVLPHGMFRHWLKHEFDLSPSTATRFMRVAERFDVKTVSVTALTASVLYLLSSPDVPQEVVEEVVCRSESGEEITSALAKQIIDTQKAIEEATKAETQARADVILAQQQLFEIQAEKDAEINELSAQVEILQEEMKSLAIPEVQIEKVEVFSPEVQAELEDLRGKVEELETDLEGEKKAIPPETKNTLEALQRKIAQITQDHAMEKARNDKLEADIQEAFREKEIIDDGVRARQEWRLISSEVRASLMRILVKWPNPIDARSFEEEDWERVATLQATLRRVLEECDNLSIPATPFILTPLRAHVGE